MRAGTRSVAGLAREAQVDRSHLTRGTCRDLADRFTTLIDADASPVTAREAQRQHRIGQLVDQLDQLKATHSALHADRDRWYAAAHTLLRAVQVLRLEQQAMAADLEQLRHHTQQRTGQASGLYAVPPPTQ